MKSFLLALLAASAAAAPTTTEVREVEEVARRFANKKGKLQGGQAFSPLAAGTDWGYDWSATPNSAIKGWIPMYHCPSNDIDRVRNDRDRASIHKLLTSGASQYVLTYNECDIPIANGGCNCNPSAAADAWEGDIKPFQAKGAKVICPAVSSFDTNTGLAGFESGLTWLSAFLGTHGPEYFGCDAQAIHWYGLEGQTAEKQAQDFIAYVDSAHLAINTMFKKNMPLWITEFAPLPTKSKEMVNAFLEIVMPELDKRDFVERYSPLGGAYLAVCTSLADNGATRRWASCDVNIRLAE